MCDYKIYKMYSKKNPDKLYIGSTKKKLKYRFAIHRSQYKSGLLFGKLNNLFSNDDVVIDLIENILKCSKEDALIREDYYINKFGFYNCRGSTKMSKEKQKIYQKEWNDKHKEKLDIYRKEYRDKHKEKQKIYQKEYREKNKKKDLK